MALAPVVSRSTTAKESGATSSLPQSCACGSPSSVVPSASTAEPGICRVMIAARPEGETPTTVRWRGTDHTFVTHLDVTTASRGLGRSDPRPHFGSPPWLMLGSRAQSVLHGDLGTVAASPYRATPDEIVASH